MFSLPEGPSCVAHTVPHRGPLHQPCLFPSFLSPRRSHVWCPIILWPSLATVIVLFPVAAACPAWSRWAGPGGSRNLAVPWVLAGSSCACSWPPEALLLPCQPVPLLPRWCLGSGLWGCGGPEMIPSAKVWTSGGAAGRPGGQRTDRVVSALGLRGLLWGETLFQERSSQLSCLHTVWLCVETSSASTLACLRFLLEPHRCPGRVRTGKVLPCVGQGSGTQDYPLPWYSGTVRVLCSGLSSGASCHPT